LKQDYCYLEHLRNMWCRQLLLHTLCSKSVFTQFDLGTGFACRYSGNLWKSNFIMGYDKEI